MPTQREIERNIVRRANERGMTPEQIKQAVLKYREMVGGDAGTGQKTARPPVDKTPQQEPSRSTASFLPEAAAETAKGFGVGLFKSVADLPRKAASVGTQIGDLLSKTKTGGKIGGFLSEKLGVSEKQKDFLRSASEGVQAGLAPETAPFQPRGSAEKVGYAAGQAGQAIGLGAVAGPMEGAGILGRAAVRGAEGVGLSAIQREKADKQALKSGALSAGLSIAGDAANAFLKKVPDTAWDKILRRTPTEKLKKPDLGTQLAREGVTGHTYEGLLEKTKANISKIGDEVSSMLEGRRGDVDMAKVSEGLDALKKQYAAVPGEGSSVDAISKIQDEVRAAGVLDAQSAQKIKQSIYKVLEDSYGKNLLDLPVKTAAQKEVARGIRQAIEEIAPEVKSANARQGLYLALNKAVNNASVKSQGQGILGLKLGLYDLGIGGGGAALGGPVGAVGSVAAKRFLESPTFLSNFAKVAQWFNDQPPSGKMAILSFIQSQIANMESKKSR